MLLVVDRSRWFESKRSSGAANQRAETSDNGRDRILIESERSMAAWLHALAVWTGKCICKLIDTARMLPTSSRHNQTAPDVEHPRYHMVPRNTEPALLGAALSWVGKVGKKYLVPFSGKRYQELEVTFDRDSRAR